MNLDIRSITGKRECRMAELLGDKFYTCGYSWD